MKIDIRIDNLLKPQQTEESKGQDFTWPTDPTRPGDDPEYVLDVEFYDGTTKPDQEDDTGYSTVDYWKQFKGEPTNASHAGTIGNNTFHFYQNSNTILAEDVTRDWDGGLSNRDYGIFERRPMQKIQYSDFVDNKEVLPVGVSRPNFEITLIYPESKSEAVKVDHKAIFKNGVYGATADVINDDQETAGYRIWSPPITVGHLKLEEKTFNSIFAHIGAAYGPDSTLIKSEKISEVEGIAWLPFNTADRDNYKLTKDPNYQAEEYLEPPVRMISQYTSLRVFTIPRKWWVWYYWKEHEELNSSVKGWGSWICPPKDFEMPIPRKGGIFELGHVWDNSEAFDTIPIEDLTIADIRYSESNAHAVFRFNDVDAYGDHDSEDRNAIYTLYLYDSAVTTQFPYGKLNDFHHNAYLVGGDFDREYDGSGVYLQYYQMWYSWFWVSTADGGLITNNVTTGFIHTMPDFKEPLAVGERAFHPWLGNSGSPYGQQTPTGDESDYVEYTRRFKTYTEEDGAFLEEGIDQKQIVYAAGIEAMISCSQGLPPDPVTSWGFAAAGVKEGDLVAVLECGDGIPIYVWRRTDEDLKPSTDFYYQSNATYYMAIPENFVFSGVTGGALVVRNVHGILEWPIEGEYVQNSGYKFNRKISSWGTWCDITKEFFGWHGEETQIPSYAYKATHTRGTIELDPPVTVLACFSNFPSHFNKSDAYYPDY